MANANGVVYSSAKSPHHPKLGANHYDQGTGHLSMSKLKFCTKGFWPLARKLSASIGSRGFSLACQSRETQNTETKERVRHYGRHSDLSRYTDRSFS